MMMIVASGKSRFLNTGGRRQQLSLKICSVDGCDRKHSSKGLCNLHYQRLIHNVPMAGNKKPTLEERFWAKVEKGPDCWMWTGAKSGGPPAYGYINLGNKVLQRAHRLSYEMAKGPIPEGLHILHSCDEPLCVNPQHLFAGDAKANMDDMTSKGRAKHPVGEANHSKLQEFEVLDIRSRRREFGTSYAALASRFGVCPSVVRNIILRKKWKHI